MGKAAEHQIATRVDGDLLRRLDEFCDVQKRSRSFVLSEALERFLADQEAGVPVPARSAAA